MLSSEYDFLHMHALWAIKAGLFTNLKTPIVKIKHDKDIFYSRMKCSSHPTEYSLKDTDLIYSPHRIQATNDLLAFHAALRWQRIEKDNTKNTEEIGM